MTNDAPNIVTIYTDGGCSPNPGPGGWAAIILKPNQPPVELVGSQSDTTNNQMELRAAIEALKALPEPHQITLITDSQYLRQGITEWLPTWQQRGWRTSQKTEVKNQDLWQALATELERHIIDWQWTKGHAGDEWNERADQLASGAIQRAALPLDDEQAIHIFTAASYLGKAKTGGWGVLLRYQESQKTLSGHAKNTSGNRMHLQAAIEGLRALKRSMPVHIYTTSGYLKDGATMWIQGWRNRGWKTKDGKSVSHQDLWEALSMLTQQYPVEWHVVQKTDMPPELQRTKEIANAAARGETIG